MEMNTLLDLTPKRNRHTIAPVRIICFSFLLIILVGTILLTLPISSKAGTVTSPLNCLFTATSATCVTGLVVYDTFTQWTPFGQGVILVLIQLGGLGLVSFTTFFTLSIRGKLGLRDLRIAGEHMNFGSLDGIQSVMNTIIRVTLLCEGIGAILLMFRFIPMFGLEGIFVSVFMAVSAYCNAGFDLLGQLEPGANLTVIADDWFVQLVLAALIIVGGLGFIVFHDIFTSRRHHEKVHNLMLHSKIVLITTGLLLLIGTVLIFILEYNHTLSGKPLWEKAVNSFFSSTTARTAGFNVINYGEAVPLTKMLTCVLMFIGASPGGTGGGVKTSTLFVLLMTVYSVMRGFEDTTTFKRRVGRSTIYKAIALVFFSIMLLTISTILLMIFDSDQSGLNLLFETTSAFSTTGLSAIGSGNLSAPSKIVLILLMYIGRVGPISFILTLNSTYGSKGKNMTLPEGKVMVG